MSRSGLALLTLAMCLAVPTAYAADDPRPPASIIYSTTGMEGLSEIRVLIENANPTFGGLASLSRSELTTQTELYVRKMPGLRLTDAAVPYLYVSLNADVIHTRGGTTTAYYANLSVALCQPVVIYHSRQTLTTSGAETWHQSCILAGSDINEASRHVNEWLAKLLDQFQNEYLKANPQIKPGAG